MGGGRSRVDVDKHLEDLKGRLTVLDRGLANNNAELGGSHMHLERPSDLFTLIEEIKLGVKKKQANEASSSDGTSVRTLVTELHTRLNTFNDSLPQDWPWPLQQMQGIFKLIEDFWQEYTNQNKATPQATDARQAAGYHGHAVGDQFRNPPQSRSAAHDGNQHFEGYGRLQPPSGQASGPKPGFAAPYSSLCENCPKLLRQKGALEIQVSDLRKVLADRKHEQRQQLQAELDKVRGQLQKELVDRKREQQQFDAQLKEVTSRAESCHAQLVAAEARNGRQADAHGFYGNLGATPLDLKESAENVRLSLEGFSKRLMRVVNKCPRWIDAQVTALNLDRSHHFKFHLQRLIAEVCFDQLWNSDDYFFFPCSPGGSGISQGKKQFFERYQRMSAFVDKLGGVAFPRPADVVQAPSPGCEPDCYSMLLLQQQQQQQQQLQEQEQEQQQQLHQHQQQQQQQQLHQQQQQQQPQQQQQQQLHQQQQQLHQQQQQLHQQQQQQQQEQQQQQQQLHQQQQQQQLHQQQQQQPHQQQQQQPQQLHQQQQGSLSTSYSYCACSCGASEFEFFCSSKLKGLKELEVWKQFFSEETPADLTRSLQDSFLVLLLAVWRAHLVSLAFDQPACLFKVRGGQDFDELSMEDTVMQEDKDAPRKVEFMTIPGFRVGKTIIKSLVCTTLKASQPSVH